MQKKVKSTGQGKDLRMNYNTGTLSNNKGSSKYMK